MQLPRIESRALKYGYANARINAMKGLLLSSATLNELIRVGTIDGMAELLQKTGYRNELSAAALGNSGSRLIDIAASRNFAKVAKKILKMTPASDRKALSALLLRWDLMNLKTIMHARKLAISYEEIEPNLFAVGALDEEDFKRLMHADEKNIGKELRRTELGRLLLEGGEAFRKALSGTEGFIEMETAVDSLFYGIIDRKLAEAGGKELGLVRKLLKKEIDSKNIMIIERLKKRDADRNKITGSLISGGTLGQAAFSRLIESRDGGAVISLLKSRLRGFTIKEGFSLSGLEIALEKAIATEKLSAFHQEILSAGAIAGFMMLKEEEVNNLRKIAKGKEFALSESDVREMLVAV